MTRWKQTERKVAEYLGGVRVPITGRIRGSAPDVEHSTLAIEIKDREKLPFWIKDAMNQAVASKVNDDQIPVAIFRQKRQKYKDAYCMLKMSDLKLLMEKYEESTNDD